MPESDIGHRNTRASEREHQAMDLGNETGVQFGVIASVPAYILRVLLKGGSGTGQGDDLIDIEPNSHLIT